MLLPIVNCALKQQLKTKRYSCAFQRKKALSYLLLLGFSLHTYNQATIIKCILR